MKKYKIFSSIILFLIISTGWANEEKDFKKVLFQLKDKFENIQDYKCSLKSFTSNLKKSESFVYNYYFRKPKMIRMEIVSGRSQGTILVYCNTGKVKLRLGKTVLKNIVMKFDPDNSKVTDLRGYGIDKSYWGWFIQRHIDNIDLFTTRFIKVDEICGRKILMYELISKNKEGFEGIAKEEIWIDPELFVISKFRLYDKDGNLLQESEYTKIELNTGIPETLFTEF